MSLPNSRLLSEQLDSISLDIKEARYSTPIETTASMIPLPSDVVKGQFSVILKGNTAANIVQNGNFASGTTKWASDSATGFSASANEAQFTATAQFGQIAQLLTINTSRKYYARAIVQANSNLVGLSFAGTDKMHSGSGQYELLSVVATSATTPRSVLVYDRRTSGWSLVKVKEVIVIDMGSDASNPLYNLTAAQMDARFASWFDGTKSTDSARLALTNTTITIPQSQWEQGSFHNTTGALLDSSIRIRTKNYIEVQKNTRYTISANFNIYNVVLYAYDASYNFVLSMSLVDWQSAKFTWDSGDNVKYVKFGIRTPDNGTILTSSIETANFLMYITATEAYFSGSLRRLNSSTYDEIRNASLVDGKLVSLGYWEKIQRIGSKILQSGDVASMVTTATNVDRALITAPADCVALANDTTAVNIPELAQVPVSGYDNVANIGKYYISSSGIYYMVAKGTTLATAQSQLSGKTLNYQLAVPVISTPSGGGELIAQPGGSIIVETDGVPSTITYSYPVNLAAKIDSSIEMIKSLSTSKANRVQENWIEGTLQNGWIPYDVNYESLGYYKDEFGVVKIRGAIKGGTVTDGTTVAILPVGYRPSRSIMFSTFSRSTGTTRVTTEVVIYANGEIRVWGAASTYMTLQGISFRAWKE